MTYPWQEICTAAAGLATISERVYRAEAADDDAVDVCAG